MASKGAAMLRTEDTEFLTGAAELVADVPVSDALATLAEHGDEAKLMAGGHSLIPLMRYRLASPATVIDISKIEELKYVRDEGSHVAIGALTTHTDVESDDVVGAEAPLLAKAVSMVGDPQVRNRGTIGGSIAHGDPASDMPSALLAMGATMVVQGPNGQREVAADDFFTGFLETAVGDDELLTEIRVPKLAGKGWSFNKFNRRSQDWAVVGASVQQHDDGVRVGLVNMHSTPVRATATEAALASGAGIEEAAAKASEGLTPPDDDAGSSAYRAALAVTVVEDALTEAMQ